MVALAREALPAGATVTVTASPRRGLEPTLDVAERLAGAGFRVVPHVAAKLVLDQADAERIVRRLDSAAVRDVFVVGGDGQHAAGAFADAGALLDAFVELGHGFEEIGIAGYPEGHPSIDEPQLLEAMRAKARSATYVVSQVCFEPDVVAAWIERMRRSGIELPVYVGVPGVVSTARLLRLSLRIGVGESVRFLRRGGGWVGRILLGGTFDPSGLVDGLAPLLADPAAGARGLHLYTFNEVARTEAWRRSKLASLRRAA